MESLDTRIKKAMTGPREVIRGMLKDPSDKVALALLSNPNITEEELIALARRRNISGEVLGSIAGMKVAAKEYRLAAVLANNPRTPRRVALGLIRRLRLGDMASVTQNKLLPTELRQAAEGILRDKLPSIPLGVKISLARQVSEEVLKTLLLDDTPQLVKACFENPRMKEAVVVWAVNNEKAPGGVIGFIADSPKWSANHHVRFALLRNRRTPIARALGLVSGLKAADLRFLYNDPSVPVAVKVQIEVELERKSEPFSPPREAGRVIVLRDEQDDEDVEGQPSGV